MLQFDGAAGLLFPGGPQAINSRNFAVPDGLVNYWGFDTDCLDVANNACLNLVPPQTSLRQYVSAGASSNTAGYTICANHQLPPGLLQAIGIYRTTTQTFKAKVILRNGANNYTVVVDQSYSHGGTGWEFCVLTTPYVIPSTGVYSAGVYSATTMNECNAGSGYYRTYISGDATGTSAGWTDTTGPIQGLMIAVAETPVASLNNFTAASIVDGKIGQALKFNGSTQWINANSSILLNSNKHSISFWLPDKGTNKTAYLFSRGVNQDAYGLLCLVWVASNLQFANGGAYISNICTYASMKNGDHYCLTLDFPNWAFYQNCNLIGSGTTNQTKPWFVRDTDQNTKDTIAIGRAGAYNNYYFDGSMDDFRVYDRVLDQSEIYELYKAGMAGRRNALNYYQNFMPMLTVPSAISQWQLYFSKNSGAYEPVTTTSVGVKSADASTDTDETKILIPRL